MAIFSRAIEFLLLAYAVVAFLASMLISIAMGWWWMVPLIAALAFGTGRIVRRGLADLEAAESRP